MNKKKSPTVRINLMSIMIERGLSIEEVASLCDAAGAPITRATVYNLTNPSAKGVHLQSIAALCAGLQVSPCDLIVLEDGK
jgi:DNA-binding Xre family transcriptional regulator